MLKFYRFVIALVLALGFAAVARAQPIGKDLGSVVQIRTFRMNCRHWEPKSKPRDLKETCNRFEAVEAANFWMASEIEGARAIHVQMKILSVQIAWDVEELAYQVFVVWEGPEVAQK